MNFNIPEFRVSEFSSAVKRLLEDSFGYVKISGEITGCKKASSGHIYFNLKDEDNVLNAVCFRNQAQAIAFEVADGLQVKALGKITTYGGRSNYQIIVEKLEISGIGAILEMIEKRRQKLLNEGLFDEVHKKRIPFFPKVIGVITSQTGSVIEDIKHRIMGRNPTHILLYPALVQGEKAAFEVISGIKFFNKLKKDRPDVIIIARGGGSFEDLLPFSDEDLVREVFKSEIPIISAIGHETDTTLIDYVADLRAPTPSAAAEMATPILSELKSRVKFLQEKLEFLPKNFLNEKIIHLKNLQKYIVDPATMLSQINDKFLFLLKKIDILTKNILDKNSQKLASKQISKQILIERFSNYEQKTDFALKQIKSTIANKIKNAQNNVLALEKLLKSNNYQEILRRGFVLLKNENGDLISSVSQIKINDKISAQMADGKVKAQVIYD
jgi:exodeoxyribonuclease VII large subunit